MDFNQINDTPFKDISKVSNLDRKAVALGFLPPTFKKFLELISTSEVAPAQLICNISLHYQTSPRTSSHSL
eukprot:3387641-Pyramimonas_sp.AAC.2